MKRGLDRRSLATAAAVGRALLPRGGAIPPSADDVELEARFAELVAAMPPRATTTIKTALFALRLSPLLFGRTRSLSHLSLRDCEAIVAKCAKTMGLRHALLAVAALCEIAYFSDRTIQDLIGYDGKPLKTPQARHASRPCPCRQYPQISGSEELQVDACVIGSGAGGATVARHLAEAGLSVAVLEEGGLFTSSQFRHESPARRMARMYRDGGLTATIGRPPVILPMGCVVGGTTVVNSGSCFSPPPDVLRSWERDGVSAARPEEFSRYVEIVERNLNVTPVSDDILGANGEVMRRGAQALGLRHGPIPRAARNCHGSGQCAFGCPLDAKQAMHVSYLPEAAARGAQIFAHCPATRLLFEGERLTGVEARVEDPESRTARGRLRVRARAVILCAGSVFSPLFLERQGIKDRGGHLARHLRIHPGLAVTGLFDEELRAWRGVMQSYHVSERLGEGILLEATYPPPGIGWGANNFPYTGSRHKEILAAGARMASIGLLVSDTGEGSVRRLPGVGPLVRYDLARQDLRRIVEGVALASRILFAAGAKRVFPGLPGVPELASEKEAAKLTERGLPPASLLKLSAFHPMGTCRMHDLPEHGVVDGECRVHGIPNLYVADASVLPGSTVVNPQITIMAFATRAAYRIADALT